MVCDPLDTTLLFNPEEGGSAFLWNVRGHIQEDSTAWALLLVYFAYVLPQKTQASCSYETSVDFYQSTWYKIPKESTHEDLSFMFPARKSGVIPMRPGHGLAGRLQIWSKTSIWSARLCKVNWCLIHSNISYTSIDLCPLYQILPGHQKWKKNL